MARGDRMKFRFRILNEVYPNKGESKKDFISRFMSVTKDEYPDIKQRYAIANDYWNRRNKKRESIDEVYGYHYGDLDYARKADRREIMGGRDTGHFGTGFYMVGTFDPDKAYNYGKRACWEVDLDKYNMFKPRSNSQAYRLHDALKEINGGDYVEFPEYEIIEDNIQALYEEYLYVSSDEIAEFYEVDEDTAFDMYLDGDYKTQPNKYGEYMISEDNYKKFEEDVSLYLDEIGMLPFLTYRIDGNRVGELEEDIKEVLYRQERKKKRLQRAKKDLNEIFGKDGKQPLKTLSLTNHYCLWNLFHNGNLFHM